MVFKWFKSRSAPGAAQQPPPARAASSVESPCNGVCDLDWVQNICKGCYRTPNEIGAWNSLDDEDRRTVLARALERSPD